MKHLLLVDDNEEFSETLRDILQRAGYDIQTASDGAKALKLFRQQSFDLVITDLIMPEKEGLETIIEPRLLDPDLKIIAISGHGRIVAGEFLPIAKFLGAVKTLSKPFGSDEILQAVAGLLGSKRLGSEEPGRAFTN